MLNFQKEALVLKSELKDFGNNVVLYINIYDDNSFLSETKTLKYNLKPREKELYNDGELVAEDLIDKGNYYRFIGTIDWGIYNGKHGTYANATEWELV